MSDQHIDPSDMYDVDRIAMVNDQRALERHELERLRGDSRVAMTEAEFAADHAARMRASAERQDWAALHSHSDWHAEHRERRAS